MSNDNDMDALADSTRASQNAINDLAEFAARGKRAQAAVDALTPPVSRLTKRTTLRAAPHSQSRGELVVEVWCDGEFVGEITAADGCGVRVISKYEKTPRLFAPLVLQVDIRR